MKIIKEGKENEFLENYSGKCNRCGVIIQCSYGDCKEHSDIFHTQLMNFALGIGVFSSCSESPTIRSEFVGVNFVINCPTKNCGKSIPLTIIDHTKLTDEELRKESECKGLWNVITEKEKTMKTVNSPSKSLWNRILSAIHF